MGFGGTSVVLQGPEPEVVGADADLVGILVEAAGVAWGFDVAPTRNPLHLLPFQQLRTGLFGAVTLNQRVRKDQRAAPP